MDSGEKPPCLSLPQEREAREREGVNLTVVVGLTSSEICPDVLFEPPKYQQ
jgi:hypothetical protein